jgi:hypothetical protein
MSSVVISGNTSGTITLDAPAVAGTTVLTLPATTGNILASTAQLIGNGTTTNDSASAGQVGEYIDSLVVTASVGTTATTLTSISLTAGDWDLSGCVALNGANGVTSLRAAINTTTNSTSGTTLGKNMIDAPSSTFANGLGATTLPRFRVNISSTTTYYLIGLLGTTATTCNGYISARRMR